MIFDYFMLPSKEPSQSYHEVLAQTTEQVQLAEQLGFETVWISEHHFGGEGYDIFPNPVMVCMHLASRTSRIRLGLGAVILPEWHPLRLAEDIAILDHSTLGRVECAVGKGITSRELSNLSPFHVDRSDPEGLEALFDESLDILRGAWTEDPFTHEGRYYTFPHPGIKDSYAGWYPADERYRDASGIYRGMSIVPKPYQQPHPQLWLVGDSEATFTYAARKGLRPITWLRSNKALETCFKTYRAEASVVQGRELALGEDAALMRIVFVGSSAQHAREMIEPSIDRLYGDYLGGLRGRDIYAEPGETIPQSDLDKPWFDFLYERGHLIVGTADDVSEQILDLRQRVGLERLLVYTCMAEMDPAAILGSLKLFGDAVAPRFASVP
jgi:alkanesulfonate monooxygenase SsuD/methylene tetrahydromethanopterin reductase-like flavin-dependent oxidoreductase (luciferase family)